MSRSIFITVVKVFASLTYASKHHPDHHGHDHGRDEHYKIRRLEPKHIRGFQGNRAGVHDVTLLLVPVRELYIQ